MERIELTENVMNVAFEAGASIVGIADVGALPVLGFDSFPRAVSYAVRLSDEVFDKIAIDHEPHHAYFHQYRTANALLDQIGFKIGLYLQAEGHRVLQIAASQSVSHNGNGYQGLFSHRSAAIRAGLGWIGRSNSLITPEFGPRVRLGTVLTHAPLEAHKSELVSQCGSCSACVQACPALALSGEVWTPDSSREALVDVRACSEHMHAAYQQIGRGVVCGICLSVCPIGKKRNRK